MAVAVKRRRVRLDPYHRPTGAGRGGPGTPRTRHDIAARIENLAELLAEGHSLLHAAERLRISYRTAVRYHTRLRAQQGAA